MGPRWSAGCCAAVFFRGLVRDPSSRTLVPEADDDGTEAAGGCSTPPSLSLRLAGSY